MNKEKRLENKLLRLYRKLLRFIPQNFDLNTTSGEEMTKAEMEKKYIQTTLLETIDEGKTILCLIKKGYHKQATLHSRKILEIYLQARLLRRIDSEHTYKSFWLFMDYSRQKQIEYMLSTADKTQDFDFDEPFKTILEERLLGFKAIKSEEKYIETLDHVKQEFRITFPQLTNNSLPNMKHTYWLGYSPLQIAKLFPDGALEIYLKLYGDISNNVHPSPLSTVEHIPMEGVNNRKWGSDAIIHGINLTVWILELFTENQGVNERLSHFSEILNTMLLDYHE